MKILVLNSGSSTQKSALFELGADSAPDQAAPPLWEGRLEWDGGKETLSLRTAGGKKIQAARETPSGGRSASLRAMLGNLWTGEAAVVSSPEEIDLIGHRIVHGGARLSEPVVIDSEVTETIAGVAEIAPLHNQSGLEGIQMAEALFPGRPQVAVFDTGFHRTLPPAALVYPGPYEWLERGIRRYGFHGINHEYCAKRAARLLRREASRLRIVTCHLGNGCSLAAVAGGRSLDTTMGFTPLEGLMMGTRSGSIDPGILVHLLRQETASGPGLDNILNHRSGLLGISGVSSDMRDVLQAANEGNPRAKLAFDIFVHRLVTGMAAMTASLGGVDAIVFTAGIGENSAEVREAACARLGFLGIELDPEKNRSRQPDDLDIASADSRVRVLVIRAQEDWAIARECVRLSPK